MKLFCTPKEGKMHSHIEQFNKKYFIFFSMKKSLTECGTSIDMYLSIP
jgi:hypothetical protein